MKAALAEVPTISAAGFHLHRIVCAGSSRPARGSRATTHWKSCGLAALYPEIDVDPDVLYTDDRRVLTSAGVAAGIDLCLHMIRSDHGADIANTVARGTVVPPHREGGQAQYIDRPVPDSDDSSTAAARPGPWTPWQSLTLATWRAGLDERAHADPQFRQETGLTPISGLASNVGSMPAGCWTHGSPVDRIAAEAGFGTGAPSPALPRSAGGVTARVPQHLPWGRVRARAR